MTQMIQVLKKRFNYRQVAFFRYNVVAKEVLLSVVDIDIVALPLSLSLRERCTAEKHLSPENRNVRRAIVVR